MPATPITSAQPDALDPVPRDWRTVMRNLLSEHDKNVCMHEETHRGGFLWTICDQCGRKWADDEGGFQAYEEPAAVTEAWALLAEPEAPTHPDALAKLAETNEDLRRQVADQCLVVSSLAETIAKVHADYARLAESPIFSDIAEQVGRSTAALMEVLGDALNDMDATSDEDDWMVSIFREAQRLFPTTED